MKEVKVTLIPMGSALQEVSLPSGSTIGDALKKGGISTDNVETRIGDKAVGIDEIIKQNEQVVILSEGNIKGA